VSHHFNWAFKPSVVLICTLLLSNNLAAGFSYLVRIVSVVVVGEVLFLDLELPLPDDEDLVGNISLLEHYLILDEGLGLQNEVDDFEELRFGPHTEKR
jgi:hypothetical protein